MPGTFVIYTVMLIAATGMLWANHQFKSKGVPWGRPLAGIFGIISVAMALTALVKQQNGDRSITEGIIRKENAYTKVSMNFLGDYLGDYYSDKKLVVLMPAFSGDETRDKMQLDALKEGIDGRLTVEVEKIGDNPNPEEPDAMMMGPEGMIQAAQFNEVMEKHKDANVFLSLAGLPMDFTEMTFWTLEDDVRPVLALANANIYMLRKAIQKRMIAVVLHNNPEAIYDPKAEFPKDPEEAFNQRFILISDDNVDDIATKYPELFKEEPKKK